jgi:negative regulator of sigma E activity
MLSEQFRQLLTAYVDGELSNRQTRAVQRLLRRSGEARALLRKLQEDSARLRGLPHRRLDDQFVSRVLQAIEHRAPRRMPVRPPVPPQWAGFAAAAAVLLAVSLGSFLYFAQSPRETIPDAPLAQKNEPKAQPDTPPTPPEIKKDDSAVAPTPAPPAPKVAESSSPERLDMPLVQNEDVKEKSPLTQETPLPGMEMFKPDVVAPPFALLEDVRTLQADRLRTQFGSETALRIELPCADTARGFKRLQGALKDAGITLAIDAAAQNRLDKPRLRSNYVIFVEDVTADELARFLGRVGSEDKKAAEAKPKPDGQFSKMVVNRLSDADRKELAVVLHVEARQLQTGPDKPGKGTERLALAVTYNPERPRANSPEVKRYLENRKPARSGAVQALLVLREMPR